METVHPARLGKYILLLMLALGTALFAQIPGDVQGDRSSSYITRTDEGYVAMQRIVFPSDPNALRYEVEIEQLSGAGYEPLQKLETTENWFEVSLRVGSYRYRVRSFNIINLPEGVSGWQDFTVRTAEIPSIETYQPYYGMYFEMKENYGTLTITGWDLGTESEYALVSHFRRPDWTGVPLEGRKDVIFPDQVIVSGNSAILHFGPGKVKKGDYDVFVRNPGGLWDVLGRVRVGTQSWVDITLTGGWSANFPLGGFDEITSPELKGIFYPGSYWRAAFIPIKTRLGNIGIEAQLNFIADENAGDNVFGTLDWMLHNFSFVTINILFQIPVSPRAQHNVRFGAGIGNKYDNTVADDLFKEISVYFDLGYSVQYFLWKNFFIDFNLDFILSHNFTNSKTHFIIRPGIGLGLQIGRWADWAQVAEGLKRGEDYSVPVTDKPKPEWVMSFGWAPMVPLSRTIKFAAWDGSEYNGTPTLKHFNPGGGSFRAAYIPFNWGNNKLGFEFELTMLYHPNNGILNDSGSFPMLRTFFVFFDLISEAMIGVRYQHVLAKNWELNLRAGLGLVPTYNYQDYGTSEIKHDGYMIWPGLKLGAGVQFFYHKNAFVAANLDMVFTYTWDNGTNLDNLELGPRLYMKPGIALGWQFNRDKEKGTRLRGLGLPRFGRGKSKPPPAQDAAAGTGNGEAGEAGNSGKLPFSVGGGFFFNNDFGGGYTAAYTTPSVYTDTYKWPYFGGGAFIFLDAKYAEFNLGFFIGKQKLSIYASTPDTGEVSFTYLNLEILGKYPFYLGDKVCIFPLLGIEYQNFLSAFNESGNDLYNLNNENNYFWFKAGAGADYSFSERFFIRAEILYGIRLASRIEKEKVQDAKELPLTPTEAKTRLGHGLTVKAAAGFRF